MFQAQRMMNLGSWLKALQKEQESLSDGSLEELQDIVIDAKESNSPIVAVVSPQPVRGYAALQETGNGVYGIFHVLGGQPEAVYHTLFEALRIGADMRNYGDVIFPRKYLADGAAATLGKIGSKFGLYVEEDEGLESAQNDAEDVEVAPVEEEPVKPVEDVSEADTESFQCDTCGREFSSERGLKIHEASHAKDDQKNS